MKILITGGCGFVGSNLAIFLMKKLNKAQIFSLDNLFRQGSEINLKRLKKYKIKNFRFDITNSKKVLKLRKFDLIIDCCAEPAIEESKYNPDRVFNTNLIGTYNILKKCIKDKSKIIFLSSSRVYSIKELNNFIENPKLKSKIKIKKKIKESFNTSSPKSIYGFSKLASEDLIKEFSFINPMKFIINRFGVIAGPWQFGKQDQGFVSLWIARHFFKKKLSYIGFGGYGNQVRDIIHIDDVCEIILKQIRNFSKIYNQTFNIGGGSRNSLSLKKLTSLTEDLTGNKIKISKTVKSSMYDIPYYVTDNSKIKRFYNWVPQKSINIIIKDIYNWLLINKELLKKYF